jgi:DNA-binding transcriptional MocR family regulator
MSIEDTLETGLGLVWRAYYLPDLDAPEQAVVSLLSLMGRLVAGQVVAWPSIGFIVERTRLSERTVQRAIQRLAARGFVTQQRRRHQNAIYVLTLPDIKPVTATGDTVTGDDATPVSATPRPVTATPKQPRTTTPQKAKPSSEARASQKRGRRLDEDWQAPAVTSLPSEIRGIVAQWPAGAYEVTATQFRNHWLAEGRAIGAKRDWDRTWHNWLIRESAAILRNARAGMSYATAPSASMTAWRPQTADELRRAIAAGESGGWDVSHHRRRLKELADEDGPTVAAAKSLIADLRHGRPLAEPDDDLRGVA